jgi:hypothetical protein
MPKIVELIFTEGTMLGTGDQENPYRRPYELYTLDGRIVLSSDPLMIYTHNNIDNLIEWMNE